MLLRVFCLFVDITIMIYNVPGDDHLCCDGAVAGADLQDLYWGLLLPSLSSEQTPLSSFCMVSIMFVLRVWARESRTWQFSESKVYMTSCSTCFMPASR